MTSAVTLLPLQSFSLDTSLPQLWHNPKTHIPIGVAGGLAQPPAVALLFALVRELMCMQYVWELPHNCLDE